MSGPAAVPVPLVAAPPGAQLVDPDLDLWLRTDDGAMCCGPAGSVVWPLDELQDADEEFGPFLPARGWLRCQGCGAAERVTGLEPIEEGSARDGERCKCGSAVIFEVEGVRA